jgi:hypothetical protein
MKARIGNFLFRYRNMLGPVLFLTALLEDMHFNWRRVVVKEYNTTFLLFASLITLKLWSEYRIVGPVAPPSTSQVTIGALIWLILYVSIRSLKKRDMSTRDLLSNIRRRKWPCRIGRKFDWIDRENSFFIRTQDTIQS